MSNVVEFPRAQLQVPLARVMFGESRRFAAEMDRRHRCRWYAMGATLGFQPRLYSHALADGRDFLVAYQAGCFARLFGVDMSECVS